MLGLEDLTLKLTWGGVQTSLVGCAGMKVLRGKPCPLWTARGIQAAALCGHCSPRFQPQLGPHESPLKTFPSPLLMLTPMGPQDRVVQGPPLPDYFSAHEWPYDLLPPAPFQRLKNGHGVLVIARGPGAGDLRLSTALSMPSVAMPASQFG